MMNNYALFTLSYDVRFSKLLSASSSYSYKPKVRSVCMAVAKLMYAYILLNA